ncbi:hypothetical protein FISHEDRAFT_58366 [Fistulina hepatica ATCC 64428]|nr:hypothetical protein FISHEDRAFT_58366 [Fistulina hepatica ATCC 64428]
MNIIFSPDCMVEPFAAVVNLWTTRVHAGIPVANVVKLVSRSGRAGMPAGFFNPYPRSVKGKERAWEPCLQWSCRASVPFFPFEQMLGRPEAMFLKELQSSRCRLRRYRGENSSRRQVKRFVSAAQRRHASYSSDKPNEDGVGTRVGASSALRHTDDDEATYQPEPSAIPARRPNDTQSPLKPPDPSPSDTHTSHARDHLPHQSPPMVKAIRVHHFRAMLRRGASVDTHTLWDAYSSLLSFDCRALLVAEDILQFCERISAEVETWYESTTENDELHHWARRLESCLDGLDFAPASPYDLRRLFLSCRCAALAGDIDRAREVLSVHIQPFVYQYEGEADILHCYSSIFRSLYRHCNDAIPVLNLVIVEWSHLSSHMLRHTGRAHVASTKAVGKRLRKDLFNILAKIEEPRALLLSRKDERVSIKIMGELLAEVYCSRDLSTDALEVVGALKDLRIPTPIVTRLNVVRALSRDSKFNDANALFHSIQADKASFRYYLSTGLFLVAYQGDNLLAEEFYNKLSDLQVVGEFDKTMFMYSLAVQGRSEETLSLFNEFFPKKPSGRRFNNPQVMHYSMLVYSHAQRGDIDGMNSALSMMRENDLEPNVYVYTMILKGFAMHGDLDSIAVVLEQMNAVGIVPNVVTYTTIIGLLAHRGDSVGAETIFKRAADDGNIPDRVMINALMNAHVEAGTWSGVIRCFDYINSSPMRHIRLSIDIFNVLIKAYVLMGAPFGIVSRLFTKLEASGYHPNKYTFALLIQSACDAQMLDVAEAIFKDMDRLQQTDADVAINVYVLTILMAAFLRSRNRKKARAVYADMVARGIQPTSVTYRTIVSSYGNSGGLRARAKDLWLARKFVQQIVEEDSRVKWDQPSYGRASALDTIYQPVMHALSNNFPARYTENMLKHLLKSGGMPSVGTLTALLNAYRTELNVKAARAIWPQIFELGLKYAKINPLTANDEYDKNASRLSSNILCIPLSMYIDVLSATGLHDEIPKVWRQCQENGFTFDAHNWNHLIVALVRAGQPERAFEVVERVLLPYQRQSDQFRSMRDPKPKSPLLFETLKDPEPMPDAPMRHTVRRKLAQERYKRKLGQTIMEDTEDTTDFVHPLHILHQVSPSWNSWRPHRVTMYLLLRTYRALENGNPIRPVNPGEVFPELRVGDLGMADQVRLREEARAKLESIRMNNPLTMQRLVEYQAYETAIPLSVRKEREPATIYPLTKFRGKKPKAWVRIKKTVLDEERRETAGKIASKQAKDRRVRIEKMRQDRLRISIVRKRSEKGRKHLTLAKQDRQSTNSSDTF